MKPADIDLNGLRVLLTVVRAGGFSAAARLLDVPPNRLSRQVQRLEETLGVRLLQRTTRKISLTTVGRSLLERVGPTMQELESWWVQASSQADEPLGHLRITAPIDFMNVVPSEYLALFLERYPSISLELMLSDDQVDMVSAGFDVAFRGGPIHDESVVARRLVSSRLLLVASAGFAAARGLPQQLASLTDYPCLALRSKGSWTTWQLQGPQGPEIAHIHARLTINGMGALVNSAKAGLGIALVPDRLIANELAAGHLVQVLPAYWQEADLYMVYPSRRHQPAALKAFLEFAFRETETLATERIES